MPVLLTTKELESIARLEEPTPESDVVEKVQGSLTDKKTQSVTKEISTASELFS